MSTVIVKAVPIRGPHKIAEKWATISGLLYVAYVIFAIANAFNHGFDLNFIQMMVFWSMVGVTIPCCGHSAVSNDKKGQMCVFGYFQFVVAVAYLLIVLYGWDTITLYKRVCDRCVFMNTTDVCMMRRDGVLVQLSENDCEIPSNMVELVVLTCWLMLHAFIHITTSYWTCKAMHYEPDNIMWAMASIDLEPVSVIQTTPQTHPPAPQTHPLTIVEP